ncbi:hypothetical protein PMAYCL1PPCAC_04573, partial [Pristionchus mayeri]
QTDLVSTVAQMNMLEIASCDCHEGEAVHKPDQNFVKQTRTDLTLSLAAFVRKWERAEDQYDELMRVHANTLSNDDATLRGLSVQMSLDAKAAAGTVRLEDGEATRARLATMINSVHEVAKYALETEMRGIAFDCSDEMRRVANELEKEFGITWRKLNAKEHIYTVPNIANAYLLKVKELTEMVSRPKPVPKSKSKSKSKSKCSRQKK